MREKKRERDIEKERRDERESLLQFVFLERILNLDISTTRHLSKLSVFI